MDNSTHFEEQPGRPVSIAMLFHLVTLAAILAACARFLQSGTEGAVAYDGIAELLIGGAILGLALGSIAAFFNTGYRWMSPLFGIGMGLIATPFLLIQIENYLAITSIAFVGSWILIAFAMCVARWRGNGGTRKMLGDSMDGG